LGSKLLQLQHCKGRRPTYHVGLRLAVMALGVEAALILASGRGRLEVRWNCARGHCVYVCGVEVRGEVEESRSDQRGKRSGLKATRLSGSVLARCRRGARTCLEPAGRTGVNAELVQMPWDWRILYVVPIYASRKPWQLSVISSCPGLEVLNTL
jgi:hypothetical protein